jgi:sterol desaturase/sphingolipid hydroxylase (fatty acid hydroxylase superfamily)
MFRLDWIERHLSRVRPAQVMVVWIPVAAWFLWRALGRPDLAAWQVAACFAAGLLSWTLLEYVLHRFVFHFAPQPGSELQRDLSFLIHGVHHDWPYDPDRLVMPPVVAALLAFAVGLPFRALLGERIFPGCFAGLVAGYLWYDLTHYVVHHGKPRTAFGRLQRRNHMVHHFAQPGARYGVTTPLWDLVFGTYPGA